MKKAKREVAATYVATVANQTFLCTLLGPDNKPIPVKDGWGHPKINRGKPVYQMEAKKFATIQTPAGNRMGLSEFYLYEPLEGDNTDVQRYNAEKAALDRMVETDAGVYTLDGYEAKYNSTQHDLKLKLKKANEEKGELKGELNILNAELAKAREELAKIAGTEKDKKRGNNKPGKQSS